MIFESISKAFDDASKQAKPTTAKQFKANMVKLDKIETNIDNLLAKGLEFDHPTIIKLQTAREKGIGKGMAMV